MKITFNILSFKIGHQAKVGGRRPKKVPILNYNFSFIAETQMHMRSIPETVATDTRFRVHSGLMLIILCT